MIKTLYFDINGTIVHDYQCKRALSGGAFECAVRRAGLQRLVCMSNIQSTIKFLAELDKQPDSLGIIFDMCWGAFRDANWFRQVTELVPEANHRGLYIDVAAHWWYVDDLAKEYLEKEGLAKVFEANVGGRILIPSSRSNGDEILWWLTSSEARA